MNNIHVENGYGTDAYTYYPVLIVGAGESGIATGWRLKEKLGCSQFRIFDRQSGVGDFVKYLLDVAAKYQLVDKIQLNTDVTELRWLDADAVWEVTLTHLVPGTGDLSAADRKVRVDKEGTRSVYVGTEKVRAKIVVSCVGILVEPNDWPAGIPGQNIFHGDIFHSARWRQDIDFKNKDVVVVGTGCSAAQVVPSLFEEPYKARSVTQLMRSPPWVMPRLEEPFGKDKYARYAPRLLRYLPILGYLYRLALYLLVELIWMTVFQQKNHKWRTKLESSTLARTHSLIPEKYHDMMTPRYSYGCKRRVFDSAWLRSMQRSNFRLTTQPLLRLEPDGIVLGSSPHSAAEEKSSADTDTEEHLPTSIIVLANGFSATRFLHPLTVYGRSGISLHDHWRDLGGPQAYMGTAVHGFPNFFMLTGPNTANAHSSLITSSENTAGYIGRIIRPVLNNEATVVEVKSDAEQKWTRDVQSELRGTVFQNGGCRSWYQDADGFNWTMYPRSQTDFTIRCLFPRYNDFETLYTPSGLRYYKVRQVLRSLAALGVMMGVVLYWFFAYRSADVVRFCYAALGGDSWRADTPCTLMDPRPGASTTPTTSFKNLV
ncbi:MAG: hypothetical protein Q9210_001725 [Variospora velana]